ncbi:hypothetical protein [Neisseria animalis]|uniref:Uncharacterized protein n=1 Tax=Neisseria animalis TaxID=492 RepID=A0A5P3MSZ4_NEIAN|nr:hypothetical protein [Neisseria animalis]QEY24205.1 hypothetical protein D0T90_06655 [Neisseria animalis]ROW32186.1 hypothetical protein CGZ60_06335 [Neisseria animalis]VEE06516.1 Uncharacterised protein [Neisseria animalis]
MTLHDIIGVLSALCLTACNPTSLTNTPAAATFPNHNNPGSTPDTSDKTPPTAKAQAEAIFYLTGDDILDNGLMIEPLVSTRLIVYNGCLSEGNPHHPENIGTLAIPKHNDLLFDDNRQLIGLVNKNSQRKILIGDYIALSGIKNLSATSSTKPIPEACSQNITTTQEIL